jgi:hypothetical protein
MDYVPNTVVIIICLNNCVFRILKDQQHGVLRLYCKAMTFSIYLEAGQASIRQGIWYIQKIYLFITYDILYL